MTRLGRSAVGAKVDTVDLAYTFQDAQPFRLTVDHYLALDDLGAFEDSGRVELIEGMIVRMNSMSVDHAHVTGELHARLRDRLQEMGSSLSSLVNATVTIQPGNAPDPDIVVADRRNAGRFLTVEAVSLLIEVSKATIRKDLGVKRDTYATAGVPEYWVVDVDKREVHRFAAPCNGAYTAEPPVPLAGELRSLTLPDLTIDGTGIL